MLMLCLNIHLNDNLSNKVNLNTDWNSSITIYNYLFIIINSSASDFLSFIELLISI